MGSHLQRELQWFKVCSPYLCFVVYIDRSRFYFSADSRTHHIGLSMTVAIVFAAAFAITRGSNNNSIWFPVATKKTTFMTAMITLISSVFTPCRKDFLYSLPNK